MHTGWCFSTRQVAPIPQEPGQGSLHRYATQALSNEQSSSNVHSRPVQPPLGSSTIPGGQVQVGRAVKTNKKIIYLRFSKIFIFWELKVFQNMSVKKKFCEILGTRTGTLWVYRIFWNILDKLWEKSEWICDKFGKKIWESFIKSTESFEKILVR